MSILARIKLPAPDKAFANPANCAQLIEFINAVTDLIMRDSIAHLYKPFSFFRKTFGAPFTLTDGVRILVVSLHDFKKAISEDGPLKIIGAQTLGWALPATDADSIRKHITRNIAQAKQGNIFCVQTIKGYPGCTAQEVIEWVLENKTKLLSAAQQNDAVASMQTAIANLTKQAPKLADAVYLQDQREVVKTADLLKPLAFVDFNNSAAGEVYPAAKSLDLLKLIESGYGKGGEEARKTLEQLKSLKGKSVVMIGTPPTGWSTAKLQTEVADFDITVTKAFEYFTRAAFYNPAQTMGDKIKQAQQAGILMLPYEQVIAAIQIA